MHDVNITLSSISVHNPWRCHLENENSVDLHCSALWRSSGLLLQLNLARRDKREINWPRTDMRGQVVAECQISAKGTKLVKSATFVDRVGRLCKKNRWRPSWMLFHSRWSVLVTTHEVWPSTDHKCRIAGDSPSITNSSTIGNVTHGLSQTMRWQTWQAGSS